MYLVPKSEVTIGNVRFYGENSGINSITIEESVESLSGSAKIIIPRNFRRQDNKSVLDYIKVGDPVLIRLGYGHNIASEFEGYVSVISAGYPLSLDIEDAWYPYRRSTPISKSWKQTTLKAVLQYLFPNCVITCPDVTLETGFVIRNASVYKAIKALKESYGFHARLKGNRLDCFWPYQFTGFQSHTYVLGSMDCTSIEKLKNRKLAPNVVKNDLKYILKNDLKLQVTAKAKDRTGKSITVKVGNDEKDATNRTLTYGVVMTVEALKKRAEAELNRSSYNGYTGSITGFGFPRVKSGDSVYIVDPDNDDREGKYLVKGVKIKYSVSEGFRREVELSYKIYGAN